MISDPQGLAVKYRGKGLAGLSQFGYMSDVLNVIGKPTAEEVRLARQFAERFGATDLLEMIGL